jgi:hypothetical protein
MNPPIIFDSFALLCFFHKEPGWEKAKTLLSDLSRRGEKALLSRINWGEFYYPVADGPEISLRGGSASFDPYRLGEVTF